MFDSRSRSVAAGGLQASERLGRERPLGPVEPLDVESQRDESVSESLTETVPDRGEPGPVGRHRSHLDYCRRVDGATGPCLDAASTYPGIDGGPDTEGERP